MSRRDAIHSKSDSKSEGGRWQNYSKLNGIIRPNVPKLDFINLLVLYGGGGAIVPTKCHVCSVLASFLVVPSPFMESVSLIDRMKREQTAIIKAIKWLLMTSIAVGLHRKEETRSLSVVC